jgi:hypothetical protein
MSNLRDLADLALVISQLKTIINTSGLTQFPKPRLAMMKSHLHRLEVQFVEDLLAEPEPTVHSRVLEARQAVQKNPVGKAVVMEGGRAVIVGSDDENSNLQKQARKVSKAPMGESSFQITKLDPALPADVATEAMGPPLVTEEAEAAPPVKSQRTSKKKDITSEDDEALAELRSRLAEEKKKLASKMKSKKASVAND